MTLWAGALAAACAVLAPAVAAAHSNALWRVVHDLCVPDRKLLGLALPCLEVNLGAGYAVVADPFIADQLLLVPTRRVVGIEDPYLQQAGAPNYWQDAWGLRDRLARRIGRPLAREGVAMAVNAAPGRSQEQLHIHVSCVQGEVAARLRALSPDLGEGWTAVVLGRHAWRVRTLAGDDLAARDPFKLAAAAAQVSPEQMAQMTLVVIGARLGEGGPGFYVLYRIADVAKGDKGHGEFLLDERCRAVPAAAVPAA